MNLLIIIFSFLVAIEFFYIMFLETIVTNSKTTGKVFNMSVDELKNQNVQLLFKNQGIYNGLIGLGILYSIFLSDNSIELLTMIMIYIILVAFYGSYSSGNKTIFVKQAGLAVVTLILILV